MEVFKNSSERVIKDFKNDYRFNPSVTGQAQDLLDLFVGSLPDKTTHVSSAGYGDPTHDYHSEVNSLGYRSPEFKKVELIAMGCSQTFGLGVCFKNIWPERLAKSLGDLSYVNLAFPGWSTVRMIDSFYKYIEQYGKPKAVAIHLPDFHRVLMPVGRETVDTRPQNADMAKVSLADATFYSPEIYATASKNIELPKISKRPYKLGEVLIPEISYHQNFMALNTFLLFCKYSEIAVAISSWSPEISELLSVLDYVSDEVYFNYFDNTDLDACTDHDHIRSEMLHKEFDNGTDLDPRNNFSHMGVHEHIHVAEGMAGLLSKQL